MTAVEEAVVDVDGPEAVLAPLDPEQREVALATRGPVCVIAGAGTGKTRAIAHRIAYAVRTGVVNPGHVLAVTFTTRAAGELRARLRQLDGAAGGGMEQVTARTFHAAALRQLTHFWPRTVGGPVPAVLDSKAGLLAEAARRARVRPGPAELRDVATEIEWAKVMQVRPVDYPAAAAKAGRTPPLPPATVGQVFAAYEALRRERHVADFESVLELTAAILAEHPLAAAEVRDRYRYFVIDEYQDVNPLQKLLLDTWAGGREEVCVVGDPRQTIYSFTGATPAYLTGFTADYPGATVLRLVRNYRSTPQVVELANRLTGASGRRPRGAPGGPPLAAQRAAGPEPEFAAYSDEAAEAAAVAARARQLITAGVAAREIAVLVRTNSQTERFERAFAEAGVACQIRGGERFFARPEVRQAMGLLRAAAKARPTGPAGAVAEARDVLAGLGLTRQAPAGRGAARERWESLAALAQLTEDLCAEAPGASLPDVVALLARRAAAEHAPRAAGVTLASLHAAKGLEWDVVFLPGLTEGNLPIVHAGTEEAVAEERRLLYVGVTRARERVLLSWPLARSAGGRACTPSRFLDGLRPVRHMARPGTPGGRAARPAVPPRRGGVPPRVEAPPRLGGVAPRVEAPPRLGGVPPRVDAPPRPGAPPPRLDALPRLDAAGEALLARLREWRAGVAREAGVPAFVVFTDDTLRRIAGSRPVTGAALAAVPGVGPVKLGRYGGAVLAICTPPPLTGPSGEQLSRAES
jgi:ATP-dependent DNA helicase UvrD/PcrA